MIQTQQPANAEAFAEPPDWIGKTAFELARELKFNLERLTHWRENVARSLATSNIDDAWPAEALAGRFVDELDKWPLGRVERAAATAWVREMVAEALEQREANRSAHLAEQARQLREAKLQHEAGAKAIAELQAESGRWAEFEKQQADYAEYLRRKKAAGLV